MKRIIISLIISITFSICAFAESATWNASFSKYVAWKKKHPEFTGSSKMSKDRKGKLKR